MTFRPLAQCMILITRVMSPDYFIQSYTFQKSFTPTGSVASGKTERSKQIIFRTAVLILPAFGYSQSDQYDNWRGYWEVGTTVGITCFNRAVIWNFPYPSSDYIYLMDSVAWFFFKSSRGVNNACTREPTVFLDLYWSSALKEPVFDNNIA